MPQPPISPPTFRHVAVIGAGPAGLVAARELLRKGHRVTTYEKNSQIGGTWVYTPTVESDPMSLDPTRAVIHSSIYSSLRTNLPREVMGFTDYPFRTRVGGGDQRRFPGHGEVLEYLEGFVREFGLGEMVTFEAEVVSLEMVESGKWKVKTKRKGHCDGDGGGFLVEEVFDAVVVCNGHHTEPRVAEITGIGLWPGKQIHSHNYRDPEPFRNQVAILIGSSFTAADLSVEIAGVAKEVHIASRSVAKDTFEKKPGFDNMWLHSMIEVANEDGTVVFQNGRVIRADIILHCTGYKYHFPFLQTNGIVTVDDNRVGPLYKHVFPPALAPWLSFVGLPWKTALFPAFELQSKWIAAVLSEQVSLPSQEEMMEDVNDFYSSLEASSIPKRYTHNLFDCLVDYSSWLAAQCRCPAFKEWRTQMYYGTIKNCVARPATFRDEWEDDHLLLQAYKDFSKYASK